jgi:hypothetical protein
VLAVVGLQLVLVSALAQIVPRGSVTEIVVPEGTQARLESGEVVVVMPAVLEMRVGDRLRIENQDVADHLVGPYFLAAGETLEISYGAPGEYEGLCALSGGGRYVLVITE